MPLNTDQLARFVELEKRRRALDAEQKEIEAETRLLEETLLDQFADSGIQKTTVNGLTVYVHRQIWAKAKDGDYPRACNALKACGLGDYVEERFNTQSLSAYVREIVKGGEELPDELKEVIDTTEKFSLRTQKA